MSGLAVERLAAAGDIATVLAWAQDELHAAGMANAPREALTLWAAVAGVSPGRAWLARNDEPPAALSERYGDAVRQRCRGVPAAYATGTAAFRTLELMVDRRVLIPRPETEGLVEKVLRSFAGPTDPGTDRPWGTVADIGTGSGAIALSLAVEGRFGRIIATDTSVNALDVARENAIRSLGPSVQRSVGRTIEFRLGDLLAPLAGETLDVLVANPPYVTEAEWALLDPGVRDQEPRAALVSGHDGMEHLRVLLMDGPQVVRPGGLIALEVDCRRAGTAAALARQCGWVDARVEPDLFGRERYLLATREPE